MRSGSFLNASLVAAALSLSFTAAARAEILVNIDKSAQRMTVTVDGAQRYVWPVSTGRPGYDTPNGTFKVNRMDADHLSQEWDNAPMPHTMFFDMHGHAIHGFFDVKHLGMPVSHGCVRLAPQNAALLFDLVKTEGMKETRVVVSGETPELSPAVAQRRAPAPDAQPMQIAPDYGQPADYYGQPQPAPAYGRQQPGYGYGQQQQPGYAQQQQAPGYGPQPAPYNGQAYYRQSQYGQQIRQQPGYGYVQQNGLPAQPPPVQYYVVQPSGRY